MQSALERGRVHPRRSPAIAAHRLLQLRGPPAISGEREADQMASIAINRNQSLSIAIRSSTSATCLGLEGIHRWAFTGPSQATCLSLKGQQEPQVRHTAERHQNAIREGNQSAISGTQRGHHQNEIRVQSSIIRSHLEDGFGVTGHQRVQSGAIKYHQVSLGRRIWATGRRSSRQSPQAHSLPLRKATAELGGN